MFQFLRIHTVPTEEEGSTWLQLFFDLVNPATLLVVLCAVLYFGVAKISSSTRHAAIATFCAFIIAFVLLTYIGTALRGPNWDFYWPWQAWPSHPGQM